MAKSKKTNLLKIRMQSTESKHSYYMTRNKKNTPEKMSFMKYDPTIRKHVEYKEMGKA